MMEDICSSSIAATSASVTSPSILGTLSASSPSTIAATVPQPAEAATYTTTAIPISSAIKSASASTPSSTNIATNISGKGGGYLTSSPTQSLPELYHDFFDPIRAGTGGGEGRYDDSDQSMSDAEMEMEMELDMMEDAPSVLARLAEMRRALETVVW
ncbi:hypothetical protein BGW39_002977 [Mortierella sp. 14UC]|nr:hypothetical protein BGW39_002977 [Mortierella sp. 14UC]